ncbi:hypothetical protein [Streptomyces sp. TLI_105]|uniref:hypothetical protein n=1 Tax=Streptomyces sp. TLI_105 TaxID=1881019 RepID=UPI0008995715|nr:hypothetical protein SAMN05428939_1508 [Streptomyces sp. TLI_105]
MKTPTGRTAPVTDGPCGIGRAVAPRRAADGALVAVHHGGDADAAARTVATFGEAGGTRLGPIAQGTPCLPGENTAAGIARRTAENITLRACGQDGCPRGAT